MSSQARLALADRVTPGVRGAAGKLDIQEFSKLVATIERQRLMGSCMAGFVVFGVLVAIAVGINEMVSENSLIPASLFPTKSGL